MGCFLGCFGASKHDKKRLQNSHIAHSPPQPYLNTRKDHTPIHETFGVKQGYLEEPNKPLITQTRSKTEEEKLSLNDHVKPDEEKLSLTDKGKQEEQSSLGTRKRVTFDSNVQEYEHVSCNEAPEIVEENEIAVVCSKPDKSSSTSESGSTLSSLGSYPPNHRYQNCRFSDDEDEELDCVVSDLDEDENEFDDDDDEAYDAEYSDEEYYSRQVPEISIISCSSMESRTKSSMLCETNNVHGDEPKNGCESPDKETKTPPGLHHGARDRSGYVHSVLNPVENTAQWKNLKAKQNPLLKHQKENLQMDLSFKESSSKSKSKVDGPKRNYEVAVDASLSTWLDSSQEAPPIKAIPIRLEPISSGASISSHGSNSARSPEERPILGALTTEELKKFSGSSSSRRSPSRSPNEKALLGTVGIHWDNRNDQTPIEDSSSASSFKGIPNTTSKYREDKRVKWHSTPFETRLERALNRDAADSCT